MKGKGKGDRSEGSSKGKGDKSDSQDCPLQYPDLTPINHALLCPRYTAVLQRSEEEGISIEELDILQTELETLLAAVAKRMRQLESEINILNNLDGVTSVVVPKAKEKGKSGKVSSKADGGGTTPKAKDKGKTGKVQPEGKRSGPAADDKPSKKFKESSGKAAPPPTPSRPKGKVQQLKTQEPEIPESPKPPEPPPPKAVVKNDAPNRFWAMVEPYCADISPEDLKVLEEVLRTHEDDAEYHKIPSLGKHYSQKWAHEDMLEEKREGIKINDRKRSMNASSGSNSSVDTSLLMKKLDESCSDDETSPFGPLTQRLVSALIEENIMTSLDDSTMEIDATEAASMSPRSLAKQLNIGNTMQLERRIKRELEEQGIIEMDEKSDSDGPDDEILAELRKKQAELRALSQHNLLMTKRLYKLAKEEMQKQDLQKRMAVADAEVMEAYRKIQAAKAKKKQPTKKERDGALKALKEREGIIKSLEGPGG